MTDERTGFDDLTEDQRAYLLGVFEWVRVGDADSLLDYLGRGGPPNLTDHKGDTLLLLAAYHRHDSAVRILLDAGADTERVNDSGQTALAAAVFRRDPDIVGTLLAAGADPDTGSHSARVVARFFDLPEMEALLPDPVE